MIKRFCDKCGKEIINEVPIKVSISKLNIATSTDFDVCIECNKKYTLHSDTAYKNYIQKLLEFFKKEEWIMFNLLKRRPRLFIISIECISKDEIDYLIKSLKKLRPKDDFIVTNNRVIEIKEIK